MGDEQTEAVRRLRHEVDVAREQAEQLAEQAQEVREQAEDASFALTEAQVTTPPRELIAKARELSVLVSQRREAAREARESVTKLERARADWLAVRRRSRTFLLLGLGLAAIGVGLGALVTPMLYALAGVGFGLGGAGILLRPAGRVTAIELDLAAAATCVQAADGEAEQSQASLEEILEEWGAPDADALARLVDRTDESLTSLREGKSSAEGRAQQMVEQAAQGAARVDGLEAQLAARLSEAGFPDGWEGFSTASERLASLRLDLKSATDRLEGLLRGRSLGALETALSEANLERDAAQSKLDSAEMQSAALEPGRYQELQGRISLLDQEAGALSEKVARLHRQADDADADPERLSALGERLAAAERRLALLEERRDVIDLTRELLDRASRETMSRAVEHLGPRMGELLSPLTGGHYDCISIDETNLAPSVLSPEKGEPLDLSSEASCATGEQVFLAARLALTSLLWPEEMPPILLDDPLVNFDPDRSAAALEIIRAFAKDTQVFIFTCHDWYNQIADRLITLA